MLLGRRGKDVFRRHWSWGSFRQLHGHGRGGNCFLLFKRRDILNGKFRHAAAGIKLHPRAFHLVPVGVDPEAVRQNGELPRMR